MSLYSERSFERYLNRFIVIHPLNRESITGVGYDLSVGLYAKVNPKSKKILEVQQFDNRRDGTVHLEPNTYVIIISKEYVYLSRNVAATFHSKSALAAQAVFLNSTTGDPNWKGRLIFSLYNASGIEVELDLDATFCTMVVQKVLAPSNLHPKESKAVIEKYLKGLEGEHDKIVAYVMREDDYTAEFLRLARVTKTFSSLPVIVAELLVAFLRVRKLLYATALLFVVIWLGMAFFASDFILGKPSLEVISQLAGIGSFIFTTVSFVVVVISYIFRKGG